MLTRTRLGVMMRGPYKEQFRHEDRRRNGVSKFTLGHTASSLV